MSEQRWEHTTVWRPLTYSNVCTTIMSKISIVTVSWLQKLTNSNSHYFPEPILSASQEPTFSDGPEPSDGLLTTQSQWHQSRFSALVCWEPTINNCPESIALVGLQLTLFSCPDPNSFLQLRNRVTLSRVHSTRLFQTPESWTIKIP